MNFDMVIALLAASVQMGTPILYATLGEILTEKSGVLNLGVEGVMAVSALGAFVVAQATGQPWLGVLAGGACGVFMALLHAVACVVLLGNQVVSGLAVTILGLGLSSFMGQPFIGLSAPGFTPFAFPLLSDIPLVGDVFFRGDALVYLSYLLPFALWFFLQRTRLGLEIRAVGEEPEAALAAGLSAERLRMIATLAGGFLIGMGGAYLSLAYTHLWTNGLSGGRGWIAVALVIFAFWNPQRAIIGAYLFGGVMAFQLRLQATGSHISSSLLLMLPYLLTIVVLAASAARGRGDEAPAGLGVNTAPEE
ncbi:MAG: ral nucleoside transport system permease protein [Desulfovibrionales bacterium]|nr:ral nucleoside transport system permease protein [Desulfovibrionales bacterium]